MAQEENKKNEAESSFRKKFKASRAALEQILFEKQIEKKKDGRNYLGLLWLLVVCVFSVSLMFFRFYSAGGALSDISIAKLELVDKFIISFSKGFTHFLFNSSLTDLNLDLPLYYLVYVPVLSFLTNDKSLAVFIVNSFFYVAFIVSVYFSVNIRGNFKSGIMAALIAAMFPFWFDIGLEFSIQTATCAFVALSYMFFIKTEELENPVWVFPMALSFSLGLITDKMFLFYVFPLIYWVNLSFAGLYRGKIVKALLIAFVIGLPFYLRIFLKFMFFYVFMGKSIFTNFNYNILWHLPHTINASGIVLFLIGLLSLFWMRYSLFDIYERRVIVFKWFIASYVILWLFPIKEANFIYPALAPLAISAGIMIPDLFRKYFIIGIAALSLLNYSQLMPLFHMGSLRVFSGPVASKAEKIDELGRIIGENASPNSKTIVSIYGNSKYLNFRTLNKLRPQMGLDNVLFVQNMPEMFLFSDMAVIKGKENFAKLPPAFGKFFTELVSYNKGDITVYKKQIPQEYMITEREKYKSPDFMLFSLPIKNVPFNFEGYDDVLKVYKNAEFFMPYALLEDMDFYNVRISFEDLCLLSYKNSDYPCGFSSMTVKSLKTTDFSVSRFAEAKLKKIANLNVKTGGHGESGYFILYGNFMGKEVEVRVVLTYIRDLLYVKIYSITYGQIKLPKIFYHFLNFEVSKNEINIPVNFKKIKFDNSMIEVS